MRAVLCWQNFKIRQLVLLGQGRETHLRFQRSEIVIQENLDILVWVLKVLFDQENSSSSFFESVTKPGCANKNQSILVTAAHFCLFPTRANSNICQILNNELG